jgi:UDP-3-O-[3-hydroxymyristoyl] N-acetylglucosamine deacetylase
MLRQRTVREKASCVGVGLHSGRKIKLEILPAPEGNGITFVRTDMRLHAELKACIDHVADTTLATTLSAGVNGSRATVGTVEHLLAAFTGLGIDNARVLVDGPEIPIMDGSASPFVEMLQGAGLEAQRKLKRFLVVKKDVKVKDGDKYARISPGSGLKIKCTVDFDHPLIPPLPYVFQFSERSFLRDLVRSRTFGFLKDVEALRERGLARGGSLDNAVVIDEYRVLNPEGLRYPDEFVRHKVLDTFGDLSLFGMTVIGHLDLYRTGHALNTQLVRRVLKDPKAYEIVVPAKEELEQALSGVESRYPAFEPIEGTV